MEKKASAEKAVREIRRKTRQRFSAEEKIRMGQSRNPAKSLVGRQGLEPWTIG